MAEQERQQKQQEKEEKPVALPSAPIIRLVENATLQPPLTRRGDGPGLIVVVPPGTPQSTRDNNNKSLDPLPQKKWAEEGYAVVQLTFNDEEQQIGKEWDIATGFSRSIEALEVLDSCSVKDRFGLIVYGAPDDYALDFVPKLQGAYSAEEKLVASIAFSSSWGLSFKPSLLHLAGPLPSSPASQNTRKHHYPNAQSPSFILPSSPDFHYASANVSHTRSLAFLRPLLGGPFFDLEAIWDEHTAYEFATRSVEKTMGTMVDEPYVNHVPVITGGIGRENLTRFYRERFIHSNPADARLELISRTVGVDRVVDEFIFEMTHDRVVDWILPGVPPTNKHLRIPFTSVVNIRGDRLYHEHIHWDQGTALAQAGLLPTYLPFPYALPDGRIPGPGKRFEYRVPVAGAETAAKLEDGSAVESNGMFEYAVREIDV